MEFEVSANGPRRFHYRVGADCRTTAYAVPSATDSTLAANQAMGRHGSGATLEDVRPMPVGGRPEEAT